MTLGSDKNGRSLARRFAGTVRYLVMRTLRYEGVLAFVWETLVICLSPLGRLGMESVYEKDLTRPLGEWQAKVELSVNEATESDIEQLVMLASGHWGRSDDLGPYSKLGIRGTITDRFQRQQKCFVGRVQGEIVHYNWIGFRWEETIAGTNRFFSLKDDEAVTHDGFTVEAWRGKSVHTAVLNHMLLFLKQAKYRVAYTVVGTMTKSPNKTHHRLGWKFVGTILYFIPRGSKNAWICRITGNLEPFLEKQIPAHHA